MSVTTKDPMAEWEIVVSELDSMVRRLAVPGGWLYQVQQDVKHWDGDTAREYSTGWGAAVFVPGVNIMGNPMIHVTRVSR